MSDQSTSPAVDSTPAPAASHPVEVADGVTLPGWAVRTDTIVVHAAHLPAPVRVHIGHDWVTAVETFEARLGLDADPDSTAASALDGIPWTAIELPEGSLKVDGEAFPPGLTPPASNPAERGARVAFWCLVFPRMRGC